MKRLLHSLLGLSLIRPAFLAVILCFVIGDSANATPLSGTKSVGPTGDYASLTAAIADVNAVGNGLGGALVLELQPAYASTVETFPLTIPALNGASTVNTLTIRPASGATALSISSPALRTVDLNGAQFVTIDGRPGGAGSNAGSGGGAASQLTIANTSTAGVAVHFINEASGNTLRYTTLLGVTTSVAKGVVWFRNTSGANGNDNNTLDHCDIGDGVSTPLNGIYSSATFITTTAQNNSGNTVSNCNVFNFYGSGGAAGVRLDGGNTDWTITGNSFYQTATRVAGASAVVPIYINTPAGNNFTVTGNFIGGSAPNAGGTAWTTTGTGTASAALFQGIRLFVGIDTPSSVQGNIVANIAWTSGSSASTLPGVWSGIYIEEGSANITVAGNTIGSGIGKGSVSVTTETGGTSFGIGSSSSYAVVITSNTIGSITVNGAFGTSSSLTGIQVTAGANTISNNTVGSTTTANSLNAATSSTSTTGQQVTGILSSSSVSANITGNTVANLNNNYTGTASAGQVRGIVTSTGANTINGNIVRNLSTTSRNNNETTAQSVLGIIDTSMSAGQAVSQNTVHSLANTLVSASASFSVTGIYFAGPTSGTSVIARNLVHSLAVSSGGFPPVVNGMYFADGTFIAQNNMVRVGLDASGTSTAGTCRVRGMYDNGTTAGRNFYHNSVYLGGTLTSFVSGSIAFLSTSSGNVRTFQNNLFVNARSNSGGFGKHYAVAYAGTGVNPTGLTAGGNLFLASGVGGVFGFYNIDCATLAAWQAATGQDATSLNTDPLFVNPTGDAATVDLHIPTNSPATIAGLPIGVTDDFDGEARSLIAPAIGADESPVPNIAVEQPVGNGLSDGVSTKDFGTVTLGNSSAAKTFTITNPGTADLTGLAFTTKDGANPGDFTVSVLSGTSIPVGSGSVTFTVTFTPSASGARSAAIHIASNVTGTKNPFDIALTGTGLTVLENWRQTFYGTTSNTGSAADAADPYHTGVPNLAVFAVLGPNQDPAKVAASLLPQPLATGANYGITFTQPAGVSGVTYGAEWSADLSPLGWTTMTDTGTGTTHTFSVPIAGNPQIFIRLRVSSP